MTTLAYPLLFEPVYKNYLWGGNRIATLYNRRPGIDVCAESWEISDRPEGMSVVRNGPLADRSLHELVASMGAALLGLDSSCDVFPLLIKIIDAKERLSVQVHPGNASALAHGGEPKTDMWYVLDAEPGAVVYAGLKTGTDAARLRTALAGGRVEEALCPLPARPGDAIYIPGGRVHAIGEGCLLLEVQQNSNTTYRLHDWDRIGADGKPRELHVDQAFTVIDWNSGPIAPATQQPLARPGPNSWRDIISCPHFRVTRLDLCAPETISTHGRGFHALFASKGATVVECGSRTEELAPGTSCLIPATLAEYSLNPKGTNSQVLHVTGAQDYIS